VDDAISLYERTFANHERTLGDTHPHIVTSRSNSLAHGGGRALPTTGRAIAVVRRWAHCCADLLTQR
jgi:hypothetical protein